MMLESLKNEIHSYIVSESNFYGFIYDSVASEKASGSYAVFHLILDSYDGSDTATRYSDVQVQYSFFEQPDQSALSSTLMASSSQTIDKLDLFPSGSTLSDGSVVYNTHRDFITPLRKLDNTWSFNVQYTLQIKNN